MADPVGLSDIADRLGVSRDTTKHWNMRGVLPAPKWTASGRPLWDWPDIERWARKTGRIAGGDHKEGLPMAENERTS